MLELLRRDDDHAVFSLIAVDGQRSIPLQHLDFINILGFRRRSWRLVAFTRQ